MGIILRRFYILFLIVIIEATDNDNNGTSSNEDRQSRASSRLVKLYSGTKPEPIICTGEGFQKDPHNCAIFYRCMKSGNGKYTVFRFQCGPGTVYDPDTEVCNHPRSTKRSECGGFLGPVEYTTHMNEIEGMQNEIPSPIVTNRPIYIASTTILKSTTMTTAKSPSSSDSTYSTPPHLSSPYPWGSSISNVYIDHGSMAYPLKPTAVTMSPFTSSHETFTITPSTTSNIPHTHPRDNICTSDGFMGDRQNCRKFYRCVANQRGGYTRYEFSCTETTIWDEDNQICNHVWAVKRSRCGYRIDKNASTNTLLTSDKVYFQEKDSTKHQNIRDNKSNSTIQQQLQISYGSKVTQTQTQISNGSVVQNQTQIHYGDRINQDKAGKSRQNQNQVSHGSAVSQSQTQIAHGNKGVQTQLQVDHSNKASQSQIQINELSKSTTTSASHVSTEISNTQKNNECTELGYMGDINDCQKFYRCIDNGRGGYVKYEFSCSEGTVWDQNTKACNHAWAVKECGSKTTTKPTTRTFTASTYKTTLNYHITSSTENYPIKPESEDTEDNEDIGYQNPILMPTSSTLSSTTSTTTTISMAMDDSKKSGNCTSSGFMGDDNDCKIFYRCVENGNGGYVKHQFKCGEGTVWDSEIRACNHAWAVKKCGGSAAAEVPETTTKKLTTSPAVQPSSTILTTSTENYQTKPDIVDTAIDEDSGYHIPEQMPTSSSTSTTITSTEKGGSKGGECTSSGFMGDDNNCKIFYRCVENGNGGYVKFEFKCGEGTVWDPEIGACNHAWAVKKCGGGASLDITEIDTTTKKVTVSSSIPFSSSTATQSTTQMGSTIDYTAAHDAGYGPPHSEISTITSSHRPPQDVNQQNIICTSSGFIGDKYDCKKFYRCVDNGEGGYISYEFTCSEGTVWDSKIDACNHNWAVDSCGESATASNIQGTVSSTTTEFTKNMSTSTPRVTITTTEITSTGSNDCTQTGYMRDAKNCKKFYRCVDNGDGSFIKYEYLCGEGTLWDQEIEACNHAWAVTTCNSNVESPSEQHETTSEVHSPINDEIHNGYPSNIDNDSDINISDQTSTTEVSNESGQSGSCINSGFIGDKNNCKKFYRCVDDGNGGFIRYEFNCGEGTVWDQSIEACNHAWAVEECFNTGNNTTSIPNDSTISTTETVTPTSQKYPQVSESTSNTEKENNEVCSKDGFIGDLNNCKIFYRCVDDGKGGFTKYEFSCGEGTYWNQEILSCDHVTSDKECGNKESHTTSKVPQYEHDEIHTETTTASKDDNYSTQKTPVSSETCTAGGFYGDQKDCKKFYRCVDNGEGGYTKFDFTCGDGSIWDQDLQTCNHETDKNKCSSTSSGSPQATTDHTQHGNDNTIRTTTEKKITSTSSSSSSTNELKCDSEGFFADPNDCRMFIRCVKDDKDGFTKYQFTCAEGTVWVQEMLTCDHDTGEAQCSSQTVTKPVASEDNQQTTEKSESSTTGHIQGDNQDDKYNTSIAEPSPESNICSSEGYYGSENDCKKFYRCVDNGNDGYTKYEFTCSDGTAWDYNIQACNHIDEVPSCQGSVLHDEDNPPTTQSSSTSSQTSSSATTSSTTQKPTDASKPSSESTTQNSQKPETCDSEGYFGNTQDCKKFYRCVDNGNGGYTKYDFTCAEGTIWDQDLIICNHPGDVVNPSCNSTDDSNTTEDSSSDNSSSGGSSSSTTQSTTEGQNQDGTSKKPDSNNVNCTKAGFYPNPNDCKKFYRCVDWDGDGSRFSVYHFECGEGTIWDPAVETCNHEESVYPRRNCSGSQSQGESQSSTTQTTTTTQEETTSESTTIKTTEQSPTSSESTTSTTTEQSGDGTTVKPAENTTEPSGESTTKTPEESTTEKPDEGTTEKQPESTTVKSSEGTTEKTNESTTQHSTEETTEKPNQSTEKQPESTTVKSSEGTTEKTNESTTQQSTEETTEKPNQGTTEQSGEGTTENQGESTTEQSGEGTSEQTGQSTTEKPGESTTEKSGESTSEQSSEGTTEQPGESTTAQTTEITSEKSEDGTTEQSGGSTTEQTDGTTQGTNTESSTSGQSTAEESSTEKSTTESATDESSITESGTDSSTNENSGNKECPETEEDQYLFVCPSSFRRHPKYCNLFYQCDENEETRDLKIAVFTCPNGTIYDESQTKCVEESKADKECEGEIAQTRRVKRRNRIGENDPIVVGKDSHNCPAAGYYAFEKDGDCSPGFLKCRRNKSNKLRAFVYQCPQGYIFWSVSRRCEPMHRVRDCRRSVLNSWSERWEIPVENRNVAWT